MRREEEVLLPLIRQLETASKSGAKLPRFPFGPIVEAMLARCAGHRNQFGE